MTWKLEDDGDGPEMRFFPSMRELFPAYEMVWATYIVPLTYRTKARQVKWVRLGLPEFLRYFVTCHYSVFYSLGLASAVLADADSISTVPGFQTFCIHLRAAVAEGIEGLMEGLGILAQKVRGNGKLDKLEDWIRKWKRAELKHERRQVIEAIEGYRNLAAHGAPLIMYAGRVPSPGTLQPFARKSALPQKHRGKGSKKLKELSKRCTNTVWKPLSSSGNRGAWRMQKHGERGR